MLNGGAHGLSELLYAFTSSTAGNGSAFAGFTGNTPWYNVALALAGSLATQRRGVVTAGNLQTHRPMFVGLTTCRVSNEVDDGTISEPGFGRQAGNSLKGVRIPQKSS
jgi:K+-transporting ATPase A subunit